MKRKISVLMILMLLMAMLPNSALAAGTLKYGSKGENVKEVQTRLHELDYYFGDINGKFNRQTENAVKMFQEMNGLKVTGEVNAATRNKLLSHSAIARHQKNQQTATPAPSATQTPSTGGTLKYGTTNSAVKTMQQKLAALGYFTGTADGKFDRETQDAVEMFQRANNLTVTGTADAKTRKALDSSEAVSKNEFYATCPVGSGDSGYAVKLVQQRLKALGYFTGSVDGKYGATTVTAVKKFQEINGLKVTGNCDHTTRKTMNSDLAKNYTQPESSQPSQSADGTLKYGTTNSAVKTMQQRLAALGYFSGTADGKYDKETQKAVEMFQRANNLTVTGTADAKTRKTLDSSKAISKEEYDATCAVGSGDSGYAVKLVQQRLKALGYYTGSVDGKYGSTTVTAVKKFQENNGLKVTGNCDYTTRKTMNSSSAKKYQKDEVVSAQPDAPESTLKPSIPGSASGPAQNSSNSQKIELVIATAQAQMGKPYVLGTSGLSTFDCSGLTMYCYRLAGVDLAHSAYSQGYQNLKRLTTAELKRGDLVVFNTNTKDGDLADHVGIYLGNGTFIHASSSKARVVISSLTDYSKSFSWGLRLL